MSYNKNKGYLKMKKLLEDIIEAITNRSLSEMDKVLTKKLQEIQKDIDFSEFKSKKELINDLKEGRNRNAVHFGAAKGDVKVMKYLIEQGGELDNVDEEGNTILMIAIQHNHLEMCRFIIEQKPDLMKQNRKGNVYPIHLTTTGGKVEVLKLLKEKGNDLEIVSDEIGSPLEWSVIHQDIECLNYLLSQKVSTSKSNKDNGMPPAFILAIDSENMEIIDSLFKYDCKVLNDRDSEGYGCVHLTSEQGKIDILKWLVENGADIMMTSHNGINALDLAYQNSHHEVVNYLNRKSNNTLQRTNNKTQQQLQKELHSNLKKKEDITDNDEEEAIRFKEKGNQLFQKDQYETAIEFYNQAFELNPYNIQVLTNRAACFINSKLPTKALADCRLARNIDLNWSRTFYREGEAYFQLREYPDSAASFWEALRLEPDNISYKNYFDRAVKMGKLYFNNQ